MKDMAGSHKKMKMNKRQRSFSKIMAVAISALLSGICLAPAQAQYSPLGTIGGYSPLTGSSSMFMPLRMLLSPASMLWRGGYGYSAPYYLANSLTYNAAYAAGQGVTGLQRQNYINNYWTNPANGPNAPVVDQVSMAPWYNPPRTPVQLSGTNQSALTAPVADSSSIGGVNGKAPDFMPVPATLDNSAPKPALEAVQPLVAPQIAPAKAPMVPAAPDFRTGSRAVSANSLNSYSASNINATSAKASSTESNNLAANPAAVPAGAVSPASIEKAGASQPQQDAAKQPSSGSNLFAQAFVEHVNSNYSGDISKALSDKQTKQYAQALGILDKEKDVDLPADRIELIKCVMQDPAEDSLTKINTVRMLIKH
jgi:hypothetical protein